MEKQFYKALPNFVRFADEPPAGTGDGNGGSNGAPPTDGAAPSPKKPREPASRAVTEGKRKRKAGDQLALVE
jgi:hypothetical protein